MTHRFLLTVLIFSTAASFLHAGYIEDRKKGLDLLQAGKHQEAADLFQQLSENNRRDEQQADALTHAALALQRMGKKEEAMELAGQIRSAPMATYCRMLLLEADRQWEKLLELVAGEDFTTWPGRIIYPALMLRGHARMIAGDGAGADTDFSRAQEYTISPLHKAQADMMIVENNLRPEGSTGKALAAYERVIERAIKSRGLLQKALYGRSRLLADRAQWDLALADVAELEKQNNQDPHWVASAQLAYGYVYEKQGKMKEAAASYEKAAAVPKAPDHLVSEARSKLAAPEKAAE